MLDKSIPYIDVIMHRPPLQAVPSYVLPAGFSFKLFKPGDERYWAEIEASVLEFAAPIDALIYYQKYFLPFGPELERRVLFIETSRGEKVATSTAWWGYTGVRRDPWLDWVAVKPEYQGQGLGKAIVSRVVELMLEIEGDRDLYLHTQTWSHKAIVLYKKLGFRVTDAVGLRGYANSRWQEAVDMLEELAKAGRDQPS